MIIAGNIDTNSSFNVHQRAGGPNVYVEAYATSGMVANTPYMIQHMGSGYSATILAASNYAYVGFPDGGAALASGCVGWVQIRGQVNDAQCGAADMKGSVGHSVFWGAAALGASTSVNEGLHTVGQIGVLLEEADASTTTDIYLTGVWATPRS